MSATTAIRRGFARPEPFPILDLIWTPMHTERTTIHEKVEGFSLPFTGGIYGGARTGYSKPAYFIFVLTKRGELRLNVSKEVFDLVRVDDPIIVNYRQGRWTKGVLEGKIAR